MKKLLVIVVVLNFTLLLSAQKTTLPIGWEELTSPDFKEAVKQSGSVCIIPMGVVEKHGPHLPLGTDVFTAREVSRCAAEQD